MAITKGPKKSSTRHNRRIREGDTVVVCTGNERGRTGTILSRTNDRVIVKGLNVRKKAIRRSQENPQGGLVEMEAPMHISNVQLASEGGKAVKLRARINGNGEKELFYREDGKEVVHRAARKSK